MTTVVTRGPGLGGVADTARWTAAARARERRRPDRLFDDPFAELLAGPDGAALLRHFHTARAADTGNPFLAIRTRWFDDFLRSCVTAGTQVVGLGAGLDARAFRLDWPPEVVLFELDQPDLLAYKEARLAGAEPNPNCTRRVVPVDLSGEWSDRLVAAGFDPTRATVWFGEGLLFYLPGPLAARVVAQAAELSAPGSHLAVDLIGTGIFRLRYMRAFLDRLAEAGSPWQFGVDTPIEFLNECGWSEVTLTEPGQSGANFGRWPAPVPSTALGPAPMVPTNLPRSYLVRATRDSSGAR
jgi:methyltransferase (TIGR00027 family)